MLISISDLRNAVLLNLAIVLGGLHSVVTRRVYFHIWPIRVCASGQSIVRVKDLETLDTKEALLKSG